MAVLDRVRYGDATWPAIGTTARVVVTEASLLGDVVEVVAGQLTELDGAASRFRDSSEVSRLASGVATRVSPLLFSLVTAALRAARLTDGAVDPTVGGALSGLGYDRDFAVLAVDGPLTVREVPGWRSIEVHAGTGTVRVPAGVVLDLGATAKAYAADRAAAYAAAMAGCGVLVSLGGDVAVAGPCPPGGWRIHLADDSGTAPDPGLPSVRVRSGGLATSSTAVRRWRRGGVGLHHIIDPVTGLPAPSPWRTVSVAAGSCLDAQIAATATLVLGSRGRDWLDRTGLPARLAPTAAAASPDPAATGSRRPAALPASASPAGIVVLGGWPA